MSSDGAMRKVLLHGGSDESFDRSVTFARRMAESFGARLHIVYTVEDPLSAGWTAEVSAARMPEVHQAIEEEARERLARLIPEADQDRIGVELALRTGPAARELIRYAKDRKIDVAIVQARAGDAAAADLARALLSDAPCAVLVLR
jgi:nucleotide-binding universal stress UspA family protein